MSIDLDQARREDLRWRILKGLDAGRPYPVSETILLRLLNDLNFHVSALELRKELDYLEDRKLVELAGKEGDLWSAELTHHGVDVVEYSVTVLPGIARPPRNR